MPVNVTLEFYEAYLLAERAWLAFSKGVHQGSRRLKNSAVRS
jgi:hypothetical protein